jgi:hypothetical protein
MCFLLFFVEYVHEDGQNRLKRVGGLLCVIVDNAVSNSSAAVGISIVTVVCFALGCSQASVV